MKKVSTILFAYPCSLFMIWKDILTKMLNDKDDGEFWAGGT